MRHPECVSGGGRCFFGPVVLLALVTKELSVLTGVKFVIGTYTCLLLSGPNML